MDCVTLVPSQPEQRQDDAARAAPWSASGSQLKVARGVLLGQLQTGPADAETELPSGRAEQIGWQTEKPVHQHQ